MQKPACPCFADPQQAAEREAVIDMLGDDIMHMTRLNAEQYAICTIALPYLCGSVLSGLATLLAQARTPDQPATDAQKLSALDEIVLHALDRVSGSRLKDLDAMPSPSTTRN